MNMPKDHNHQTWVNRLKLAARSEMPDFSPTLHTQIMQAVADSRRMPSARLASHWRMFPKTLVWTAAAAMAVAVIGIMIHTVMPTQPAVLPHPSVTTTGIASLVPEPVHLLEQATKPLRRQCVNVSERRLTAQAGQVAHYMIRRISLFNLHS